MIANFSSWVQAQTSEAAVEAWTEYQKNFQIYSQEVAQLNRNKQLYARASNESTLAELLTSARATLLARQKTMVNYTTYLADVCAEYMANQIELSRARTELLTEVKSFEALKSDFDAITTWYVQDDAFAKAMTQFEATAYRAYAWIYWTRLTDLTKRAANLVETQQDRILAEAETGVVKTEKTKLIKQTERALVQLQKQLLVVKADLASINSYATYTNFAHQLEQMQSDLQANWEVYASLE